MNHWLCQTMAVGRCYRAREGRRTLGQQGPVGVAEWMVEPEGWEKLRKGGRKAVEDQRLWSSCFQSVSWAYQQGVAGTLRRPSGGHEMG